MSLKFNLETFAQSLQKIGQGMLQGGLLIGTTGMIHRGGRFYGGSIWGCGGFIPGGCPPPLNIWHPMYSQNTVNPYLTQQGMDMASQWGAAKMREIMQQLNASQAQTTPQIQTDPRIGEELQKALDEDKDYSFVSEQWTDLNNKENKTQEETTVLQNAYNLSAKAVGASYLSYLDQKFGNSDNEMTKDEFTDYLMNEIAREDSTNEDKAQIRALAEDAFNKLNINGDDKINAREMGALISYIDSVVDGKKDGILTRTSFGAALDNIEFDPNFKDDLQEHYDNLADE